MVKVNKGVTLSIAPYKTITLMVTECDNFEEANKLLMEELDKMPEIKELNVAEIKKVFNVKKN